MLDTVSRHVISDKAGKFANSSIMSASLLLHTVGSSVGTSLVDMNTSSSSLGTTNVLKSIFVPFNSFFPGEGPSIRGSLEKQSANMFVLPGTYVRFISYYSRNIFHLMTQGADNVLKVRFL